MSKFNLFSISQPKHAHNINFIYFILVIFLVILGLNVLLASSSFMAQNKFENTFYFIQKQLIFGAIGVILLLLISQLHYSFWLKLAWPLYIISLILLILVFIPGIGKLAGGARRWLTLGPFSLQPSDVARFSVILLLARLYAKTLHVSVALMGITILIIFIPAILIALEPDFSTALHLIIACGLFLFFTKFPLTIMVTGLIASLPIVYYNIINEPYRLKRFLSFLDPWKLRYDGGFQLVASYKSFLNGGLWGKGLGEGLRRHNLQARHTDFIMAVIAEDLGFMGVLTFLLIFLGLIVYGFFIMSRIENNFGRLLGSGFLSILSIQVIINLTVTMGLIPTTGISLPLISYGGSSLVVYLMMFGIILNISRETKT